MWKQIKDLWGLWLMLAVSVALGLSMYGWQWKKAPASLRYAPIMREQRRLVDSGEAPRPDAFPSAPDFAFVDQDGRAFSSKDLLGKVWIGDFFFTSCAGTCPMMSAKMAKLQKELPGVQLVSFSVDPAHDTPAILKGYGAGFGADFGRWHFLATDLNGVFDVAQAFGLTEPDAKRGQPLTHSEKFVLVDGQYRVRGVYSSLEEKEMKQLAEDARGILER